MWPSGISGAVAYTRVGGIITETTKWAFGTAVNPHLFRHYAVHTISHRAERDMAVATALLSHTDARVTHAHFKRGSGILAVENTLRFFARLAETGRIPVIAESCSRQ
jgi:integrase